MNWQADGHVRHRIARAGGQSWSFVGTVWAVVLLGVLGFYWQTIASIVAIWIRSETYTHGFLILPLSAYLIWRRRGQLAEVAPRAQWLGLLAVAGGVLLWLAGEAADVLGAKQFAVVGLIPAVTWTLLGSSVVRAIAFPLGYLVFAIPWGQFLVPTLQDFTAAFSVWMLELTGIPVFWEGRLISIPVGDFEVAEACSGIRYVIASLALGSLYAYLSYRSHFKRVLFIVGSLLVPVIANGLRAYGIILLAHLSNMRLATGVDHLIYGWVFFGLVMLLLFWIGSFWADRPESPPLPERAVASLTGDKKETRGLLAVAILVLGVGGMGPAAAYWTDRLQRNGTTQIQLPSATGNWQEGRLVSDPAWNPDFRGADVTRHQRYRHRQTGKAIHVLIIHYRRERQGAELINDQNVLYGGRWRMVAEAVRPIGLGRDRLSEVRELHLTTGQTDRLVWSWYAIGSWMTPRAVSAKAFAALNRLLGRPGDATLMAVAADLGLNPESARNRLRAFLVDHPELITPRGVVRVKE